VSLRIEARRLPLRTRHPFVISRGGSDLWPNVVVRLEEGGLEGWGEGAPRDYYGATPEACLEALRSWRAGPSDDIGTRIDAFQGPAPARAALDIALHDLLARRRGLGVTDLLCDLHRLEPGPVPPTSFTIAIDTPEAMAARAAEAAGYPILKIKLGTARDLAMVEAVRSAAPARIRVDANNAWTVEETRLMAERLQAMGVQLIEQPLPAGDLEGYRQLHGTLPLPVFADESCRTLADVEKMAGLVDGINIKLSKSGGLTEAARMIKAARGHGLQVMVGCFIESSLGCTAAACLAPFADHLDLDGAALLAEDPFEGLRIPGGRIEMPEGPGLGVRSIAGFAAP
jgi:L-alanine-DL-glutamate epimerase-like enolase superfamily enzyme